MVQMYHVQIGKRHRVYGLIRIVRNPLILLSALDVVTCIPCGRSLTAPM